jgi:hypothetical protein
MCNENPIKKNDIGVFVKGICPIAIKRIPSPTDSKNV